MAKAKGTGKGDVNEWSKTGTCLNKPQDGWIHSTDELEKESGISYPAKYIGCMEIIVSMKTLDFDTRTAVARESIYRVVEASGLRNPVKRKKDKKVQKHLGDAPNLINGGEEITLTVTAENVALTQSVNGEPMLIHNMEEISFASGGDTDTADFVAYVAKDALNNRACHVLECNAGMAPDVIVTIAQAFELRYKQMLKKKKQPVVIPDRQVNVADESAWGDEEPMYYNEGAELDAILREQQSPPPIPPLPDHYSARPNNLPVQADLPQQLNGGNPLAGSPLYENTDRASRSDSYTEAVPVTYMDSPRNEPWFHGKLKRNDAERLLQVDGDFLVRESSNKAGQFVLSGMKSGLVVHLLLVDPQGVVRTKDRTFDNVSHLISYHKNNMVPILSQEIELYLTTPVLYMP